jgi:hypothetical protein
MDKEYICKACNYNTSNNSNYNKHIKTKKHIKSIKLQNGDMGRIHGDMGRIHGEKWRELSKNAIKKEFICEFCKKTMMDNSHKARHLKTCKEKKKQRNEQTKDEIINNLQKEKEKIMKEKEILLKEKEKIINEEKIEKEKVIQESKAKDKVIEDCIEIIKNSKNVNIIGNVINNTCLNMNYVIKNYGNAPNYEDIMAKELTLEELEYIDEYGPAVGREKLIIKRCIDDIDKEERSLHCVDYPRDKFALKTKDEWVEDLGGEKMLNIVSQRMTKLYNPSAKNLTPLQRGKRNKQLIDMYKIDKKTVKNIGKQALLKNKLIKT